LAQSSILQEVTKYTAVNYLWPFLADKERVVNTC